VKNVISDDLFYVTHNDYLFIKIQYYLFEELCV